MPTNHFKAVKYAAPPNLSGKPLACRSCGVRPAIIVPSDDAQDDDNVLEVLEWDATSVQEPFLKTCQIRYLAFSS